MNQWLFPTNTSVNGTAGEFPIQYTTTVLNLIASPYVFAGYSFWRAPAHAYVSDSQDHKSQFWFGAYSLDYGAKLYVLTLGF